jgi:hypothetical protein
MLSSRLRSLNLNPHNPLPSPILRVDKKAVALRQLESAIMLWFQTQEHVSIHTLAVAAHDCYSAMDHHAGPPLMLWNNWLKQQTPQAQEALRHPQNFFKHGRKDFTGNAFFTPLYAELLILESASVHERLNGKMTPLMLAFALRFVSENPKIVRGGQQARVREIVKAHSLEGIEVDELMKLNRSDFLAQIGPGIERTLGAGAHRMVESP